MLFKNRLAKVIVTTIVLLLILSTIIACQPKHECQSVCQDCGLCTNQACQEDVCVDKCQGHVPPHSCQSVCSHCGKCRNTDCLEEICADKCSCHYCENVCDLCGKCTNQQCAELACEYKCSCEICVKCGKCYSVWDKEICTNRCTCVQGVSHLCESICDVCGLCLSDCIDSHCFPKCDGNHPSNEWETYVDKLIGVSYTYTVPTLTAQQEKDFCNLYQAYVDSDRENNYDGGSGDIILYEYYGKFGDLHYLCIGYEDPLPIDPEHILTVEGIEIYASRRQYVFVSDGTSLVRIDHAYEQQLVTLDTIKELPYIIIANKWYNYMCENSTNPDEIPTTFQINMVGQGTGYGKLFYIGEKITQPNTLTPLTFRLLDINYDYKDISAFCKEYTFYCVELGLYISELTEKVQSSYWYCSCYYTNLLYQAYLETYCK